jgi:hypothetical protein
MDQICEPLALPADDQNPVPLSQSMICVVKDKYEDYLSFVQKLQISHTRAQGIPNAKTRLHYIISA